MIAWLRSLRNRYRAEWWQCRCRTFNRYHAAYCCRCGVPYREGWKKTRSLGPTAEV